MTPAPVALRIRDVSPTGLLLSFDGLPPDVDRNWFTAGAAVGLALPVMTANGLVSVAARGQIKGVFPAGMAIKLINPDERLLAAVHHLLLHGAQTPPQPAAAATPQRTDPQESSPAVAAASRQQSPRPRPPSPAATRNAAVAECRQVMQHHTSTLISSFMHRVSSVLLVVASSAPQQALKRQFETLRTSIHEAAAAIGNRIEQNLRRSLEARLALASAESSLPEIQLPAELTLVATRELRDSIAWADAVARIQTQLRSRSYEVERRFADLLKHEVDRDADPLGVPQLCIALRDAVVCESPAAEGHQRYLAEAIEGEVAGRIGALYDDLNEVLKKHGTQAKPATGRSQG